MQDYRLTMVAAVLVSAAVWPANVGAPHGALAPITAVYALLTVTVEVARRLLKRRCLTLVGALLLADGLWIAAVVARTGVHPTTESRALQGALRHAIADRGGYVHWDVDHAGRLVNLLRPERERFHGRTLAEALDRCLVSLMVDEWGTGAFG